MPAILSLLLQVVPMIPKLIEAGQDAVELYSNVQKVIAENRSPDQAEWAQLEAMIAEQQAIVRDTSKDV